MNKLWGELLQAIHRFHKLGFWEVHSELTQAESMTLLAIDRFDSNCESENLTVSELAKKMKCQSSAVSRTLKALEDKGMIERTVNRYDRRNTHIVLLQKGKDECEEMKTALESFAESVIAQVGETELRQLLADFNKLYEVANEELECRRSRGKE